MSRSSAVRVLLFRYFVSLNFLKSPDLTGNLCHDLHGDKLKNRGIFSLFFNFQPLVWWEGLTGVLADSLKIQVHLGISDYQENSRIHP